MAAKTEWAIDPGHSEVQFKVKHLAIANVSGTFKTFNSSAIADGGSFDNAAIHFVKNTNSLDTNNSERET